jgi:hypothetical protein
MNTVTYDTENPDTIAENIVCNDCRETAERDQLRLALIARIADGEMEQPDLEQLDRLVKHLLGEKKDLKLTAAGIYSLTRHKRKKIRREMGDEFGPRVPKPE